MGEIDPSLDPPPRALELAGEKSPVRALAVAGGAMSRALTAAAARWSPLKCPLATLTPLLVELPLDPLSAVVECAGVGVRERCCCAAASAAASASVASASAASASASASASAAAGSPAEADTKLVEPPRDGSGEGVTNPAPRAAVAGGAGGGVRAAAAAARRAAPGLGCVALAGERVGDGAAGAAARGYVAEDAAPWRSAAASMAV
jgi:hypothetical protein